MLNKSFQANLNARVKSVEELDDGDLIIEGYANTVTKDRAGDVIPADTWRKASALSNYNKNPIILAFHDHTKPIGRAIELDVRDVGLHVRAKISRGAGNTYDLIKDGTLGTFSVGFMIKDAEYESATDTFFITEVELTEISVVSVPCNQDSTFSVAKSIEDSIEYEKFKSNFRKDEEMPQAKDNNTDLEQFRSGLLKDVEGVVKSVLTDKEKADAAKAAAAEKAAKEAEETAKALKAREEAEKLVAELQKQLKEQKEGENTFQKTVEEQAEQIKNLKDEIAQVMASARTTPVSTAVSKGLRGVQADEKDVDALVMLSMITKKKMEETQFGKKFFEAQKAVNTSSSIQVSSEAFETEFGTNLIRDIQAELVVAPLFTEIQMNAANLVVPVNPESQNASWVGASAYGTNASSGVELEIELTERTLRTFKLAAKTYLTDETEEDTIIAMVPILRQHLVEAHANEIDRAFLLGSGTNMPKGLVTQAKAIGSAVVEVTEANADNTVKVTAKSILRARRRLGLYGIKRNDIALIISQDAYWDLLEDDEWGDVQQIGNAATKLQGEIGNIYGMSVIVSNQFDEREADGVFGVLVNRKNFVVPRQRGLTIKTDFDVEKDRRVFVATQRLNLQPWIEETPGSNNGKGVVALTYAGTSTD